MKVKAGNPPAEITLSYDEIIQRIKVSIDQANYNQAARLAQALAEALPLDSTAQIFAADTLVRSMEPTKADEYADRVLNLNENPAAGLVLKSRIHALRNDPQKAIAYLDKVISLHNDNSEFYYERGVLSLSIGDVERAESDFKQALTLNTRHIASLVKLSQLPGYVCSEQQKKRLEFFIHSGQFAKRQQLDIHFLLANAYEQAGNATRYFEHLHAGNAIASGLYAYNPEHNRWDVDNLIKFFSEEFFEGAFSHRQREERLIFIIGMPRSGSTLIEQILCAHSMVASVGETPYMMDAVNSFSREYSSKPRFPLSLNAQNMDKIGLIADHYAQHIERVNDKVVIVDKTLGNFFYTGLIHLIFPNAKFIHAKRHPVATCFGCYKRQFAPGVVTYSYDLDHLVAEFTECTRIIDHWKSLLPAKIFTFKYEALVKDQRQMTEDLLDFCELPWEEQCLDFHENSSIVTTSSQLQVKKKLYTQALNEWEKYSEYLGPLIQLAEAPSG